MNRRVLLKIIPLVAGGLLIALFLRLGFWQLDRGAQKAQLFAAFEQGLEQSPMVLDRYRPHPRYTPVRLEGRFTGPTVFLDNRTYEGRPGVHVYVVFETAAEGPAVLVNLGWRPIGPRRELPVVEYPSDGRPVRGLLTNPPPVGVRLGDGLPESGVLRVPYLELPALEERLNLQLAPQILLATDQHPEFVRDWRPALMPPERHQAYAFQWFSLAAAVLVIILIMQWRKRSR
ncbi:MAG: SURF1 family protein [Xanthomonadales bacterium]|nr:SURF1 family protein [Xanthomonadales bacterium]